MDRRVTGDRRAPEWTDPEFEVSMILCSWERQVERRLLARRSTDSEGMTAFWADIERIKLERATG